MNKLIRRMIEQNPHYGTENDEDDVSIYQGAIRCTLIEAIFWRYRGRRLPARAVRAINRAARRYQRQEQEMYEREHKQMMRWGRTMQYDPLLRVEVSAR